MRLTLRTLLAYLDDILEEGDIQVLKAKIEESGLAMQLIERIRKSVDNGQVGALSPDAIGPLENANVMSEYLDSTLSNEQIAEIERLCLESDTSLAEASACHQILTVVLGQPAQVPDSLRQKIYALPQSDALRVMEQETQPAADFRLPSKTPVVPESVSSLDFSGATDSSGSGVSVEFPDAVNSGEPGSIGGVAAASGGGAVDPPEGGAADFENVETKIRPVGPFDSGVSHAAVRMRNDEDENEAQTEAEFVARTTRAMQEQGGQYGGSIRPSRITPWLVTLAMTGVVAYVLGQIFAPLSNRSVRDVDTVAMENLDSNASPTLDPLSEEPPNQKNLSVDSGVASEPVAALESENAADDSSEMIPAGDGVAPGTSTESPASASPDPEPVAEPSADAASESDANLGEMLGPDASPRLATESPVEESMEAKPVETDLSPETITPDTTSPETMPAEDTATDTDKNPAESVVDATSDDENMSTESDPVEETLAPQTPAMTVAKLSGEGALILAETAQGWSRLVVSESAAVADGDKEAANPNANQFITDEVRAGQTVIAPALYRPVLSNEEGLEWTLAGPTRMRIAGDQLDVTVTEVIDGRLLLASTQPGVTTTLQLGPRKVKAVMPEAQTVLAVELVHFRPAGMDALVPLNRLPIYRIIVIQGEATIQGQWRTKDKPAAEAKAITLDTGQQWQGRGNQEAVVTTVSLLPPWIDDAAQKNLPIASARDGLMKFFDKSEPLEKTLREAMAFRRIEVAALAAETLLLLGRADVYFGSDGILSRPRQRLFWTEHFQLLRQHIASDAETAADVRAAVELAESADSENLFKLLTGFSQEELSNGGDEELVELLDSASMPVRVLAIENLKAIIGDDLGYRADQENANSRRADIKKWEARLRKGDIRYSP